MPAPLFSISGRTGLWASLIAPEGPCAPIAALLVLRAATCRWHFSYIALSDCHGVDLQLLSAPQKRLLAAKGPQWIASA